LTSARVENKIRTSGGKVQSEIASWIAKATHTGTIDPSSDVVILQAGFKAASHLLVAAGNNNQRRRDAMDQEASVEQPLPKPEQPIRGAEAIAGSKTSRQR
jgi:hypothetical protein